MSLGGDTENKNKIFNDEFSAGSFYAMSHGVLTVFAGGNYGPSPASLANFSPWSIIVGAGNLNRKFVTKVKLGNNKIYEVNIFSSYSTTIYVSPSLTSKLICIHNIILIIYFLINLINF